MGKKWCGNFNVVLKVVKEEIGANHSCGARKGNNAVPAILIIIIKLASEDTHEPKKNVVVPILE